MIKREEFLLEDKKEEISKRFIKDGWITIYHNEDFENNKIQNYLYCYILNSTALRKSQENSRWDIDPGREGKPSIITYRNSTNYHTFADKGIEPFIFPKHFKYNDGHDFYIDISEEFILYFKLYEKAISRQERKYYFIDEIGELEEVIILEHRKVKVKLKYLMEYISVRKMNFTICFDFMRLTEKSFNELDVEPIDNNINDGNFFYNHYIRSLDFGGKDEKQSWIHGKLFIKYDKTKTKTFHFDYENQVYEKFIVGYEENGDERLMDCEKENGKLFTLTYFKKSVLDKYYNEPSKYNVDGWYVSSGFFSLKIDNNNEDYVAVFLVELGHLPYKEQLHWKQHNIAPQNGISSSYYKTMIEGEWVEHPETPDLYFKHKYDEFNKNWEAKFGWKFYKDLSVQDKHIFTSLHVPTTNNVKSFCEQILSISKLTIDRLNEAELQKEIILEKNDKGITKLEKFLQVKGFSIPDMIVFLRNLYYHF